MNKSTANFNRISNWNKISLVGRGLIDTRHHDGCRYLLTKQAPRHQQIFHYDDGDIHICIGYTFRVLLQPVMLTSSHGNIFRVTGPLCGEFTGHRWIPSTKARDAELWHFLWSAWINSGVNNREARDLRCHCAHYDATVMLTNTVWERLGSGQPSGPLFTTCFNFNHSMNK